MEFTASQIAAFLKGEIEGDPEVRVSNVSKIEEGKPGSLSFLANPKYEKYIYETASSIVLVNKSFRPEKKIQATLIRVDNAYEAFASLLDLYQKSMPQNEGVSSLASLDPTARIGDKVYVGEFTCLCRNSSIGAGSRIYPQVYIGDNVKIGENTVIYAGVKIYHDCIIGSNCIIHSGVVIGSDGFGFAPQDGSEYKKIPQIGNVIIEDNVELGSNLTIDRATMGSTVIRKGAKLDNLIQIAHNVDIGENTVIAAQAGISGSTKVGRNCMIAGQVGLTGHLNIADDVKIAAQAGVSHDLKTKGEIVGGSPAVEMRRYRKAIVIYTQLPELREQVLKLEKEVSKLRSMIGPADKNNPSD
jgi:UDP-3-O-[3-hydroxymyristoyl] glucosamine N-acyltransferase